MKFSAPLLRGTLVRRYKRFLADIEIAGDDGAAKIVTAHCANPGSMMGLTEPGNAAWLSPATNPNRKLKYTWELVRAGRTLVGVNPMLANRLAEEAIAGGKIAALAGFDQLRREVKYGQRSRIDFLLSRGGQPDTYVEVKSVTLRRPPARLGEFPDAVTARGARHLRDLGDVVAAGHRAVMLYIVQRGDCEAMTVAADIDPAYGAALTEAQARGVDMLCYACKVTRRSITVADALPVHWPGSG